MFRMVSLSLRWLIKDDQDRQVAKHLPIPVFSFLNSGIVPVIHVLSAYDDHEIAQMHLHFFVFFLLIPLQRSSLSSGCPGLGLIFFLTQQGMEINGLHKAWVIWALLFLDQMQL